MSVINACGFSICDGICIPFKQLCKYFTLCNNMIMKKIVGYHSYPLTIAYRANMILLGILVLLSDYMPILKLNLSKATKLPRTVAFQSFNLPS